MERLYNEPSVSMHRRTWAEIDLNNAEFNFKAVKKALDKKTKICCVIKANAYGHGAVALARLYTELGADFLAVSNIEEALQLRRHSVFLPLLILGYTPPDCAGLISENDISQCVYSYEYGNELAAHAEKAGVKIKIHIKLDTGMGRIGFLYRGNDNEIDKVLSVCRSPYLIPEGIFTHFAVADENKEESVEYTRKQFSLFTQAVGCLEERGISFALRHCANSAAVFSYPEYHLDMVRAGVVLYGLKPSPETKNLPELRPVMELKAVVSHVKTLKAGETVSYGRDYTATGPLKAATVPIGYADGFRRSNSNAGYCLFARGKRVPVIGRVCMDQLMLDVTGTDIKEGDIVTVFGKEDPLVSVDEMARRGNTINYEVVCALGDRVPRAFIRDGAVLGWQDYLLGEEPFI